MLPPRPRTGSKLLERSFAQLEHLYRVRTKQARAQLAQEAERSLPPPGGLFQYSEAQRHIFFTSEQYGRFRIFPKGRRLGATRGAAHAFIEWMLRGEALLWGDTTQANLKRYVERYFLPALHQHRIEYAWNSTDKVLRVGSGYTDFRSAERPENWEGFGYKRIFLNEAGIILSDRTLYENTVRPMLLDYADSQLIAAGVPKGHNAFYEMFLQAMGDQPGYYTPAKIMPPKPGQTHFAYTWQDNPWLDPENAARIFEAMPDAIRLQEELGQFVADGAGVFRRVAERSTGTPLEAPEPGRTYFFGVDWGKHNDFTVISVWDDTGREVYLDRFNQIDYAFQVGRLAALAERFRPAVILAESNSMGEPLIEQLRRQGLPVRPFHTTNASKAEVIEALALDLERGAVTLLDHPVATAEMLAFQMERLPSGLTRYSAPEGLHDDCIMARALGRHAARRPRPNLPPAGSFSVDY